MRFVERMKEKWGVGPWGVAAILASFALAGMTVVRLKDPVLGLFMPDHAPKWLGWLIYIVILMPIYQLCLLGYGTLLGQFHFFWGKFKKIAQLLMPRARAR